MSNRNMSKAEWEALFEKKKGEMDQIGKFIQEIETIRWNTQESETNINWEDWFLSKIKTNLEESKKLLSDIEEAHTSICVDTDDENSYETRIQWIYTDFEVKQKQQEIFFKKLFWQTKELESGGTEKIDWLEQKIDDFFTAKQTKINALLKEAEEKLSWASTSVELATVFSTKVREYNTSGRWWSGWFIFFMIVIIGYYMYVTHDNTQAIDLSHVWTLFLYRLPLIWFWIWLVGFFGNRRAEAKKLEESYKHKEVMARAYVGYRKSVEELNTADNQLLETHMENLLQAISEDSSKFLKIEWEKHPFVALFWCYEKGNIKNQVKTNEENI